MARTALYELLSRMLDQDVCDWCRDRRSEDPAMGWRTLAEELSAVTGRKVSHMSLSAWCRGELEPDEEM